MDINEEEESRQDTPPNPRFYRIRNAAYANLEEAERLVREDPSILQARNRTGETAFHFLVVEDKMEAVRWLLDHGSEINTLTYGGATPLMEAASLGYLEMCRFLLEHGADPRIRDSSGDTALSEAATSTRSNLDVVRLLLDRAGSDEDLNDYFGKFTVWIHLDRDGPAARLLEQRGLRIPPKKERR